MARASPPSVMRFIDSPARKRPITETRMAMGMELQTITMPRQLPRKNRIMSDTSADASRASRSTSWIAARTKTLWSKSSLSSIPCGADL